MKCNVSYIGKLRNGRKQYYCSVHKFLSSDKNGNKLDECLCDYKELFDNRFDLKVNRLDSLKIVYQNILSDVVPKVILNNEEFNGVLVYEDSVLCYKDLGGIMLSKLNGISLEKVKCNHCGKYHSDNGKFAYTPHSTHLCLYCGHLFRVKNRNINNEFDMIFSLPDVVLKKGIITVDNECNVIFDVLSGALLINDKNVDKVIFKNKERSVVDFLNDILKNEF